jgi:hypothetical protein
VFSEICWLVWSQLEAMRRPPAYAEPSVDVDAVEKLMLHLAESRVQVLYQVTPDRVPGTP